MEEAVEQAAGSPSEEEQECLGKLREDRPGVRRVMRQHKSVGDVRVGESRSTLCSSIFLRPWEVLGTFLFSENVFLGGHYWESYKVLTFFFPLPLFLLW